MVFLLILTLIYFLPTIIARNHGSGSLGFGLLNLFLGITGIGWLVLLLWALLAEPRFCYPAPLLPGTQSLRLQPRAADLRPTSPLLTPAFLDPPRD